MVYRVKNLHLKSGVDPINSDATKLYTGCNNYQRCAAPAKYNDGASQDWLSGRRFLRKRVE
jgi:hypothetical protein